MIEIYCDGACEPVNPGGVPAWGYVIYDDGRWIHEASGIYGESGTSNVAEYAAVLMALGYLAENGLTREPVKVYSDSQLLVNQLTDFWKVHAQHLQLLYSQAKELEGRFPRVFYRWIPREKNEYADSLSRLAYGQG